MMFAGFLAAFWDGRARGQFLTSATSASPTAKKGPLSMAIAIWHQIS
jgi:hypothetical protein